MGIQFLLERKRSAGMNKMWSLQSWHSYSYPYSSGADLVLWGWPLNLIPSIYSECNCQRRFWTRQGQLPATQYHTVIAFIRINQLFYFSQAFCHFFIPKAHTPDCKPCSTLEYKRFSLAMCCICCCKTARMRTDFCEQPKAKDNQCQKLPAFTTFAFFIFFLWDKSKYSR